jgi:murein DD-endopeptidase MepM/ murein hydrolase activator NlpD
MEIILVSKRRGKQARVGLNSVFISVVSLFGLALVTIGAVGGYMAAEQRSEQLAHLQQSSEEDSLLADVRAQKKALAELGQNTELSLNSLAARLARLQSRMIRLDALGSRLTNMANIAPEEFNFDSSPAVGGPLEPAELRSVDASEVFQSLAELNKLMRVKEDELSALEMLLMNRRLEEETQPAGRPIASGWISSGYGSRTDPVTGKREFHAGLDFAGRSGSEVLAVAAGVVTWSGDRDGYGNMVEINHGNGYVTRYSHNRQNLVEVGDKVDKNQVIAKMGSTGRSTGPHVHFEVLQDGKLVNPRTYVTASNQVAGRVAD